MNMQDLPRHTRRDATLLDRLVRKGCNMSETGKRAAARNDDSGHFGSLSTRLVREQLIPTTPFGFLPYDYYCPSALTKV